MTQLETPTENLKSLEARIKAILETFSKVLVSPEDLSYDHPFFWYEAPYDLGEVMGELDSAVQNLENSLQMIAEREHETPGL
jgi:hypothetical protein